MLRKKFSPPASPPRSSGSRRASDRLPLPKEELSRLALRYHFALRWLDVDEGKLEHFVLLAQHLVVARSLGKLGCFRIPENTLHEADIAISTWANKGLQTGEFRVDQTAFSAIQTFLLAHDEQLLTASRAAVSVALADLEELRQRKTPDNTRRLTPMPATPAVRPK
ncbi:hypothetical protein [Paraburkholderia caballeronis]|uniref:hypothetical protein n=1 Tax=Paraburkholderia caballeronis TaxID=416943 RepID=UPI00106558F0|nr:hypothetical protein [Paraburkholderia caballeronis]